MNFSAELNVFQNPPLVTHDQVKFDTLTGMTLFENLDKLKEYDFIGNDNGQFFSDLVDISYYLQSIGKEVIVCCLNSDYNLEPFPNVSKLIPFVDKIKLMTAYCFYCHQDANCSLSLLDCKKDIPVYPSDKSKPVCKNCYKFFTEHEFLDKPIVNKSEEELKKSE